MENNKKAKVALILLLVFAALVTAYPVISNFLYDRHCSRVEAEYFAALKQMDDEALNAARKAAEEYNALLSKGVSQDDRLNAAAANYSELLNMNGDGTMCYIHLTVWMIYKSK